MKASTASPRAVLGIADHLCSPLASDSFITAFVLLGSALRRYLPSLDGRQLVVALSVPRRDYVAALIGAGWMMSAPAPKLDAPVDVFRAVEPGTHLRAVTEQEVITGVFTCLNEARTPPRVITGGTTRALSFYRAVAQLPHASENVEGDVPEPGFLGRLTGAAESWLERIAAPTTDLALIGTTKWLLDDLAALVGNSASDDAGSAPLANYVLPEVPKAATWATAVIPAARMRENNPIPSHCATVILDRYGAIKYLDDITVPIIVCIIDRSVADDSAAELVIQARVASSRPVSITDGLRWQPPAGVEALAFTVAL